MISKRNRHLEVMQALSREFGIEHEDTDQPYVYLHQSDFMPVVEGLLRSKPGHRDSDARLYHDFLIMTGHSPKALSAFDLLKGIHYGQIPHWEAISRAKRELQHKFPELKGRVWTAVEVKESQPEIDFEEAGE